MPTEDFDPEKTLFFQRRRGGIKLGPRIVAGSLVLGSGVLVAWTFLTPAKPPVEQVESAPYRTTAATSPTVTPRSAAPAPDSGEPPLPVVPEAGAPLDLNVAEPGNAQVRDDVLRRIDLMPGVSAGTKDKLYASVDHARSMGRVLTIPFVKGETAVRPAEIDRLRQQLASPEIRPMADDPTVVFVILGYADPEGSDKVNSEVSLSRARNVLDTLRDKCGVQNVMHAVAMGGSTLFSSRQTEKNRVVEVWAVLP